MKQRMTMVRNGRKYRLVQYYFGYVVEDERTAKTSDTRPHAPYTSRHRDDLATWLSDLGYLVTTKEPADQ